MKRTILIACAVGATACAHRSDPMFHDDDVAAREPMEVEAPVDAELGEEELEPPAEDTEDADVVGVVVGIDPAIVAACDQVDSNAAFFEFDSAKVPDAYRERVEQMAECMTTGPLAGRGFEVVGMADRRGPEDYNHELGEKRAQSVADMLESHGVDADRLETVSLGEEYASRTDAQSAAEERKVFIALR